MRYDLSNHSTIIDCYSDITSYSDYYNLLLYHHIVIITSLYQYDIYHHRHPIYPSQCPPGPAMFLESNVEEHLEGAAVWAGDPAMPTKVIVGWKIL